MENNAIEIAPLAEPDLPAIAEIHIRTWRHAYRGQVAQDYLDRLDLERQLKKWREIFAANRGEPDCGTLVAHKNGRPVGFLSYGPARDQDREGWMEIYAAYVAPECWGQGAGYALFEKAGTHFIQNGFSRAYLWVLAGNKIALDAYRRWGGGVETGRAKNTAIGDETLAEIAVTFGF